MRWTITRVCSSEDGTTVVVDVATIERPGYATVGDVGLQLAEGSDSLSLQAEEAWDSKRL